MFKAINKKLTAASAVVASTLSTSAFALDGTEGDSVLADIATGGAIVISLTLAVMGYIYLKKVLR